MITLECKRTSVWSVLDEDKPCERAVRRKGVWKVSFLNLNDMMRFVEEHKRVVLTKTCVEIYDDYRE